MELFVLFHPRSGGLELAGQIGASGFDWRCKRQLRVVCGLGKWIASVYGGIVVLPCDSTVFWPACGLCNFVVLKKNELFHGVFWGICFWSDGNWYRSFFKSIPFAIGTH